MVFKYALTYQTHKVFCNLVPILSTSLCLGNIKATQIKHTVEDYICKVKGNSREGKLPRMKIYLVASVAKTQPSIHVGVPQRS